MELVVILGIVLTVMTFVGHGIWVALAWLFRGGRPARRRPSYEPTIADDRTAALRYLDHLSSRSLLDRETHTRLIRLMSEDTRDVYSLDKYIAMMPLSRPAHQETQAAVESHPTPEPAIKHAQSAAREPEEICAKLQEPQSREQPPVFVPAPPPRIDNIARLTVVAEPPAEPHVRPQPRRPVGEVLAGFMAEKNIRWGELVGGLLIVGCSTALVISLWSQIEAIPLLKFLLFTAVTAALFGCGLFVHHRWNLPATGHALLLISTLLVPLNVLAFAAFSQPRAMNAIALFAEIASLVLFGGLTWRAGRVVMPRAPIAFAAGVIGLSASSLIVRFLAPATGPQLTAVSLVPIGIYVAAVAASLCHRLAARPIADADARSLLLHLGILTFAAFVPLGLLIYQADKSAGWLGSLSTTFCLMACPPLFAGAFAWDRLSPRSGSLRTTAVSILLSAVAVMLATLIAAWPMPSRLLPAMLINGATMIGLAFLVRRPLAHALAIAWLASAWVLGAHLALGRLGWSEVSGDAVLKAILSAASGQALTAAVIGCGLIAEWLRRARRQSVARVYTAGADVIGAVSTALVTMFGFAVAGDPHHVTWVYLLYAAAAFLTAGRRRLAPATWAGCVMLQMALIQTLVYIWPLESLAWPTALLVGATVCGAASIALQLSRQERFADVITRPLMSFAVLGSLGTTGVMCFTVSADSLDAFSARMFWVFVLWATLAFANRLQALFAGAQLALLAAAVTAGHSYLRNLAWYQALPSPTSDPRVWQVHCAVVAAMGLMWAVVRLAFRARKAGALADSAEANEPARPAWREIVSDLLHPELPAADRWMSTVAGLGVIALTLWGLVPAIAAEHGWGQAPFSGMQHLHASGLGSWIALCGVAASLFIYRREGMLEATRGLAVLAAGAVALIACRWDPDHAVTAAWRWLTASTFAAVSIAFWAKEGWTPAIKSARRSSAVDDLRPYFFILFAAPSVIFSATFATALGSSAAVCAGASDVSLRISLLGPPVLTAFTLFAYGLRERRSAYAVMATFVTCAMVTIIELVLLARGGTTASPATLMWLVQLNGIALSIFTLAWHAVQKADSSRRLPDYPRWPIQVVRAAIGVTLALAAAALWLRPGAVPTFVAQAGTAWGILAVGLVEWSSLSTKRRSGSDTNARVWPVIAATVIACGLAPWDTGNWLCFHALLIGLLAAGCVRLLLGKRHIRRLLGAGWQESFGAALTQASGEAHQIDHDLSCTGCSYNLRGLTPFGKCPECGAPNAESLSAALDRLTPSWSARLADSRTRTTIAGLACTAIATLFALRGALDDPQRPWWSAAALASSAVLCMGLAAWAPRRGIAYLAGIKAMLAVSVWWLVRHWPLQGSAQVADLADLLNVNVIALCLAGAAWLWLERTIILRKLAQVRPKGLPPFHHATAAFVTVAIASLAALTIHAAVGQRPIDTSASLTWLAWTASVALTAACLARPQMRHAPTSLYLLGLSALVTAVARVGLSSPALAWSMSLLLSGYVLITTLGWRLWRKLDPKSLLPSGVRAWLPYANGILALASIVLAFYTSVTHTMIAIRLLVALPAFICAASAIFLAHGKERRFMWTGGLGLAALGGVLLAWSLVAPGITEPWLHRAAALLAATSTLVPALGIVRTRVGETSSLPTRDVAIAVLAAGGAALLYVSASEVAALAQRSAVPLAWPAVIAVIAGLVLAIASFLAFALRPAFDPLGMPEKTRGLYVYLAEIVELLLALHVRATMPWLFSGLITQYWPILLVGLAFAATAAGEVFERRRLLVLARPLGRTGIFLPALTALDFFLAASRVHYSIVLVSAGMFYAVLAGLRRSPLIGLVAAFCINGSLWYLLHHTPGLGIARHPQLWFIPPALAVLAAGHLNRRALRAEHCTALHYGCLLTIYISSTADIFLVGVARAPWLPLVLGSLSVAGIFIGIGLRLRSFLQLGTGFLCLSLLTIIWHAAANLGWTWVWYVAGIALGVTIIAVFALFEKKKNEMNALLQNLRQWAE